MRLIKKADRIEMPWKNGGGSTFEIDRFPQAVDRYDWRVSQAAVTADGPFSTFPGYDRWIVVWEGVGFQLNQQILRPFEPYRLRGEDPIRCSLLRGPVTDIGLIFNRATVEAKMQMISGPTQLSLGTHYIFTHTDWIYEQRIVAAGDVLRIDSPAGSAARAVTVPKHSLLIGCQINK